MAQFELELQGKFEDWKRWLDETVPTMSASSNLEEFADREDGNIKVAIRVYERFSYIGGSRLSLHVVLIESLGKLWICANSTGGSQAVLWKINYIGEENFLKDFKYLLDEEISKTL